MLKVLLESGYDILYQILLQLSGCSLGQTGTPEGDWLEVYDLIQDTALRDSCQRVHRRNTQQSQDCRIKAPVRLG